MKDKLINIVLIVLLTLTPLAIIPDEDHYNLLKIWILLIGGATLLVLFLAKYKDLKLDKKDYVILGFAFLIFLSTMFSSHVQISIIGGFNRYEGMLTLYTYILIYFCAKKYMNTKYGKIFFRILPIMYIAICLLGIAQNYIKFPNKEFIPIFSKGACGTFGNTNFMGSFLAMGMPLFMIPYILKKDKLRLVAGLMTFFCLLACQARSGWVGFGAFLIVLIAYLIKKHDKELIKRFLTMITAFIIIFAIEIIPEDGPLRTKFDAMGNDFASMGENGIFSNRNLGSGRIGIWRTTIELVRKISNTRCWNRQFTTCCY